MKGHRKDTSHIIKSEHCIDQEAQCFEVGIEEVRSGQRCSEKQTENKITLILYVNSAFLSIKTYFSELYFDFL